MITLRDGGSAGFVTVTGQILMAAHSASRAQKVSPFVLDASERGASDLRVVHNWSSEPGVCQGPRISVAHGPSDHEYCLGHARVYNRLHAISTRSLCHLQTNKFDFTLIGLSKSDLEVVRSMPQ